MQKLQTPTPFHSCRAQERLKTARAGLGPGSIHLVRINSAAQDTSAAPGGGANWRAYMRATVPGGGAGEPTTRPAVPPQGLGAALSSTNLQDLAAFVEDFAVRALLPAMETRLRTLNHQVCAS